MIINNGVENGKVYGRELEGSNTIKHKERIGTHKTKQKKNESIKNETKDESIENEEEIDNEHDNENTKKEIENEIERELVNVNGSQEKVEKTPLKKQKENEIQEDEPQEDKKNNIITLAIGCSIVLIVILALIISTIKNKSKKAEEEAAAVKKAEEDDEDDQEEQEEDDEEEEEEDEDDDEGEGSEEEGGAETAAKAAKEAETAAKAAKEAATATAAETPANQAATKATEAEVAVSTVVQKAAAKEAANDAAKEAANDGAKEAAKEAKEAKIKEISAKLIEDIVKQLIETEAEQEKRQRQQEEERKRLEEEAAKRLQEEEIKRQQTEEIQNLLNTIFDIDVNKINQREDINKINEIVEIKRTDKYKIFFDSTTKRLFINLLNNQGETIMSINNNYISFYSDDQLYKSIDLTTLKIKINSYYLGDKNEQECDNNIIEQLQYNHQDIKQPIISLLKKSTELGQDEINQEHLINFLKNIKEDLIKNLKQKEEIENLLNNIFDINRENLNKTGSITLKKQYKIDINPDKKKIENIYLLNNEGEEIIKIDNYSIFFYYYPYIKFDYKKIDLQTLEITCHLIHKNNEKQYDKEIIQQLNNNYYYTTITTLIENLLKKSIELREISIINIKDIIDFLKNITEDLNSAIEIHLQKQEKIKPIQNLLKEIFNIDVNKIHETGEIKLTEQYSIYLNKEKKNITNIYLLNKEGTRIMEISNNFIKFGKFLKNKSINLETLEITCKIDKKKEQEYDNEIIQQLKDNNPNITEQIKFLLEQSRKAEQNLTLNLEQTTEVLKHIKEDLKEKIKIYLEKEQKNPKKNQK